MPPQNALVQNIESFVSTSVSSEKHIEALNWLLINVQRGETTSLKDVILQSGDYLTSPDEMTRVRATLLLSELLTRLPQLKVDDNEKSHLLRFLTDRCDDFPATSEAIMGILALFKNHQFNNHEEFNFLKKLKDIDVQTLPINSRLMALEIINILSTKYLQGIIEHNHGQELVEGLLHTVENEKDPRMLITAFELIYTAETKIPQSKNFVNNIFEIISCYYPIKFKQREDDKKAIKTQQLADSLKKCFVGLDALASEVIPFLIDKFSSSVKETKVESVATINYVISEYSAASLLPLIESIWSSFHSQTLTSKDASILDTCLDGIEGVRAALSLPGKEEALEKFLNLAIKDCNNELRHPDAKVVVLAGKMLCRLLSDKTAAKLSEETLPKLIEINSSSEHYLKLPTLELLKEFTRIIPEKTGAASSKLLTPFAQKLFDSFLISLTGNETESKLRTVAVLGLSILANQHLLDPSSTKLVFEKLTWLMITDPDSALRKTTMNELSGLSRKYPDQAQQISSPILYTKLSEQLASTSSPLPATSTASSTTPASPSPLPDYNERTSEEMRDPIFILPALTSLATHQQIIPSTIQFLLEKLAAALDGTKLSPARTNLSLWILSQIETILVINQEATDLDIADYFLEHVYLPLLSIFINHSLVSQSETDSTLVKKVSVIFKSICQNLKDEKKQERMTTTLVDIILSGNLAPLTSLTKFALKVPVGSPTLALVSAPLWYRSYVIILASAIWTAPISWISAQGKLVGQQIHGLIRDTEWSEYNLPLYQTFSSLLNKYPATEDFNAWLDEMIQSKLNIVNDESIELPARQRCLALLLWTGKGLMTRNHPKLASLVDDISKILSTSPTLDSDLAINIHILISDFPEIFSSSYHSIIKPLYKQKVFTLIEARIMKEFKELAEKKFTKGSPEAQKNQLKKMNYLIALSNLINQTSKAIVFNSLQQVFPLLLESLRIDRKQEADREYFLELQATTLSTLTAIFADAASVAAQTAPATPSASPTTISIIVPYTSTIIPTLLKQSRSEAVKTREAALSCLQLVASFPFTAIFPFKNEVLRSLNVSLDDKKRLVRKQAVKTRNSWFILGSAAKK